MGVREAWCTGALAAALISAAGGCGGDSTGDPREEGRTDGAAAAPSADPGAAKQYVGRWEGVTSQGLDVVFMVESAEGRPAVTFIGYDWQVADCKRQSAVTFPDPAPIVDGRMVARVETSRDATDIGIRFSDDVTAEGSLGLSASASARSPGCAGEAQVSFSAARR